MAVTQVTITQTPQQVAIGACMLQSTRTFEYGFGVTQPTIFFTELVATKNERPLQYSGTYGVIWVKVPSGQEDDILKIAVI